MPGYHGGILSFALAGLKGLLGNWQDLGRKGGPGAALELCVSAELKLSSSGVS